VWQLCDSGRVLAWRTLAEQSVTEELMSDTAPLSDA